MTAIASAGMKRKLLTVAAVVAAVVAVAVWFFARQSGSERPFTDLNAAVAELKGWEVHTPPPEPGPYRKLPDESFLAGGDDTAMNVSLSDGNGKMVERLRLKSEPTFDQLVVKFETPTGRRTMAVLKRPRQGK